ncbi:MAG: helix-turn-helix domain-containing protein [Candidatus Acidiferrales bacterium]
MGKMKFRDSVKQSLSPEAQKKAHELAQQDLAEMELSELREKLELTQQDLASKMKVTQVAISRLEGRADIKVSTLRDLAKAMGGELKIIMVTARGPFELTHLGKSRKAHKRQRTRRRTAA